MELGAAVKSYYYNLRTIKGYDKDSVAKKLSLKSTFSNN